MIVCLRTFMQTGMFGSISIGVTRQHIYSLLGNPDDYFVGSGKNQYKEETSTIWKYGDFEFYFSENGDHLCMIFADHFDLLCAGKNIELDPWFVKGNVSLAVTENMLNSFSFEKKNTPYDTIEIVLESGVELYFDQEKLFSILQR